MIDVVTNVRICKSKNTMKIHQVNLHKKLSKGRLKARWKYVVERGGGGGGGGEAIILPGWWSHRRRNDS